MPQTAMPATMPAIEISKPGPPGVLRPVRRPLPVAGPGEVLVRVAAAGVNRPDCLQRQGNYPPPTGASDLPGLEVAGTVVACGEGVDPARCGERVCALLNGGGYAGYVSVPAVQCLPIPGPLGLVQAAALPEALFTVWANLFERGRLAAGETVLVHGGASGIGTTAIQLAAAFGAHVYATAGSDDKCRLCESLGATLAINHRTGDFATRLREAAGERPVDVILDISGAGRFDDNMRLLRDDGRLVVIAVLGGSKATLHLGQLLLRRLTITGSTLRARPTAEKGRLAGELHRHVWPLLEAGRVAPVIQAVLPLVEAARAHEILEADAAMGKLVLRVDDHT